MATKNKGKVVYFGQVLMDLTADTITADKILASFTAHDAAGNAITGTCDFDVNSQDATVTVDEMLIGKTSYARGVKMTGTMPDKSGTNLTVKKFNDAIVIPKGFHDGSGKASIDSTELAKLVAGNIKQGVTILGVTGTLEPSSSIKVHAKTVTPSNTSQTVLPDAGYDYLSQVVVNAVPYAETENSAGGLTVTIG